MSAVRRASVGGVGVDCRLDCNPWLPVFMLGRIAASLLRPFVDYVLASLPRGLQSAMRLSTDSVEKAGDNRAKNRRQSKSGTVRSRVHVPLPASSIRSLMSLDGLGARREPPMFFTKRTR